MPPDCAFSKGSFASSSINGITMGAALQAFGKASVRKMSSNESINASYCRRCSSVWSRPGPQSPQPSSALLCTTVPLRGKVLVRSTSATFDSAK